MKYPLQPLNIDHTTQQQVQSRICWPTMVVAPGRMIDSFLSIPDAESLPLYRMVLKLACVCAGRIDYEPVEAVQCK